jgi:flavin reductase (DIM6/NTAB) family NADH-FMN oxidoreductase RutF
VIPAPRVKEAKICLECRLLQVVQVGGETAGSGFWVIGEIVHFHINDAIWNDGYIDVAKLRPVGRMAGYDYVHLNDIFRL